MSVVNGCEILDVELIAHSGETNDFSLRIEDEHTVKIFFEYADKEDGIVVQIIHTGTDEDVQIDCKIKGGKPVKNIVNEAAPRFIRKVVSKDIVEKAAMITMVIMIVLLFGISILFVISIFNPHLQAILFSSTMTPIEYRYEAQASAIAMAVIVIICSIIISAMYIPLVKKYFNMGIPKKLKKYSDF